MIAYLAPGKGRGHATRAAAIARRCTTPVVVLRDEAQWNEALDLAHVAYEVVATAQLQQAARALAPSVVVADCHAEQVDGLDWAPVVYVWRLGRTEPTEGRYVAVLDAERPLPHALPHEVLPAAQSRALLGPADRWPLVVAVPSWIGGPSVDWAAAVRAPELPASWWLAGADVVVGAAGCNLYHEVVGCGVAGLWWRTTLQDQILRAPTALWRVAGDRVRAVVGTTKYLPPDATYALSYAAQLDHLAVTSGM